MLHIMDSTRPNRKANRSPYRVGATLQLKIHQSLTGGFPLGTVSATIIKILSKTRRAVVLATINLPSETPAVVLKIFDRRCGFVWRRSGSKVVQHTEDAEAAYQSFIRSGEVESFVHTLAEYEKASGSLPDPYEFYDDDVEGVDVSPQSKARLEAALWMHSNEDYDTETRAYAQLHDLQGSSIPSLFALASLDLTGGGVYNVPEDLRHGPLSTYVETKVILMDFIPGPILHDLPSSKLCCSSVKIPHRCQAIVQDAVNAVHEINRRGVILPQCSIYHAVYHLNAKRAFIIDFAQSLSRDEKIRYEVDICHEDKEPGWSPDVSYWDFVFTTNNTGAIGGVMQKMHRREKGVNLAITLPDIEEIRKDVQSGKCRWENNIYNC